MCVLYGETISVSTEGICESLHVCEENLSVRVCVGVWDGSENMCTGLSDTTHYARTSLPSEPALAFLLSP